VRAGAPTDVLVRSANAYTIEQTENLILGNIVGKEFELTLVDIGGGKAIEVITDRIGSVALHIRPEDIIISTQLEPTYEKTSLHVERLAAS